MEFILFLCAFVLFFSILVKIMKKSPRIKLPPGPRKLPIIGNMHQLYGRPLHHILRDLTKKYGPLMHLKFGEIPTYIITSPEVAKEVFKTHDLLFSQRSTASFAFEIVSYNFADVVFSPYGDYRRQLRRIAMLELLSVRRVRTFRSIREEEVLNMMKSISLEKGSIVNISQKIFSLTSEITARAAFGRRNKKNQDKFLKLVEKINKLTAGSSIADFYPSLSFLQVISGMRQKLKAAHQEMDEVISHIVQEHKEKMVKPKLENGEAKEDLVDVLLNIQKNEVEVTITDTNLKALIFDIFIAGSDTSSTALEWVISEIIKNPRVLKRAQEEVRNVFDGRGNVDESSLDELKYMEAIVKESLRLHPSAPIPLPRECSEQCKISGYDIPAKARFMVNVWAINRDPNYWSEAETFNPDRFLDYKTDFRGSDYHYLPFGVGRRMCPGMNFALANIMLPLAQLLFHFDWKLPGDMKPEDLDMDENTGVTIRRKNDLKLIPIPYCHSSLKK